jgi:hypothetical protein
VDPHVVARRRRHVLADEVGADRELTMATVHEDREADRARTPIIHEGVHRRAHGATGEEHVVDEHHDSVVDGERDLGLTHNRRIADTREVVAIQSDIDGAQGKIDALVLANGVADPRRERVAARTDADDREKGEIAVALDDLVRDPCYRPTDVVRPKQRGRLALLPGLAGPVLKGDRAPTSIGIPAARGWP